MNTSLSTRTTIVIMVLLIVTVWIMPDKESPCSTFQLKSGDYLSSKYIEVLERTYSPVAAEGYRTINLVVIEKKENGIDVLPIMYFHEGGPSFRLDPSGKLELEDNAGLDVSSYQMNIVSSKEITFTLNQFPSDKYIYVSNVQQLLSKKCVAGEYVDAKGSPYLFESNGTATTPDGIFRFTVGVDHIPYSFDYLEDSATHQIYRFVRKKCTLEIYRVLDAIENQHGNDGRHVEPFLSLQLVNCCEAK